MNRKWIYVLAAALILIALNIALRQILTPNTALIASSNPQSAPPDTDDAPVGVSNPAPKVQIVPVPKGTEAEQKENIRKGFEVIVEGLKRMGATEVPPIADQLKAAAAKDDPAALLQAFSDAIYARFARMSDAIPAIKPYLASPDPYQRYLAAETLLRVGDQSGVETLLALVQSEMPISHHENDLRIAAATTLAMFNVREASEGIRDLYSRTKEGELLTSLSALGVQAHEAHTWNYIASPPAIENYAKEGSFQFTSNIASTFEQATDAKTKNAAAWAMAKMTSEALYVNHLIDAARPAIESADRSSYNPSTEALRYLGTIQSPRVVAVMEQALQSRNPVAVQYATVNLLFNQATPSPKAEQLLISEFETSPRMLGTDLAMQIASKSNNPKVQAAAQSFAARTGSDRWRYWGVERATWPVQNWIYDYTVTLNQ